MQGKRPAQAWPVAAPRTARTEPNRTDCTAQHVSCYHFQLPIALYLHCAVGRCRALHNCSPPDSWVRQLEGYCPQRLHHSVHLLLVPCSCSRHSSMRKHSGVSVSKGPGIEALSHGWACMYDVGQAAMDPSLLQLMLGRGSTTCQSAPSQSTSSPLPPSQSTSPSLLPKPCQALRVASRSSKFMRL